jgi:hypothetical protein
MAGTANFRIQFSAFASVDTGLRPSTELEIIHAHDQRYPNLTPSSAFNWKLMQEELLALLFMTVQVL